MTFVFFAVTAVVCIFVGFMIATIQASQSLERMRAELDQSVSKAQIQSLERMRAELDQSVSKAQIRYALHASALPHTLSPHTLSHSAAWNWALLDIAKTLGIDD